MKRRWIIGAGVVIAGGLCVVLLWPSGGSEQRAVEATRRALRQEGFKTDLSEFDFSTSPELRARAAALTHGEFSRGSARTSEYGWSSLGRTDHPDMMTAVGTDAALVAWRQEKLPSRSGPRGRPAFMELPDRSERGGRPSSQEVLNENRADLDSACEAALSGPIRFNLAASQGSALLLPHLAALRSLTQVLGSRTVLELHDGHRDAAWTNLTAATRLVTAWEPEPAEISQMVRFALVTIGYGITWQALQAGAWTDDRLASLEREWESVDFFKGLPETAAFTRASTVATCRLERQQPLGPAVIRVDEVLRSPSGTWQALIYHLRQLQYRHHGSYEDEKALLLHYRDHELELRRAVEAPTWLEMRQLPGVTNAVPFHSKYSSAMQSSMNLRQMTMSFTGRGQGTLGRAAEAEARRRLIVTAIALERYRGRHGSYPASLQALVPELLPKLPLDFMDGQPLRYRITGDGHFVLYSVGLDCVDNGGKLQPARRRRGSFADGPPFRTSSDTDLVWPRPASAAEAEHFRQEELNAVAEQADRIEGMQANFQWDRTAKRQAKAESILRTPPPALTHEPAYHGRPLSQVLRNKAASGTNQLTLAEMLTLKQVLTGAEPEVATFELPVNYDVMTNIGNLELYVDPAGSENEDSNGGSQAVQAERNRATNGNCRLVWNTIYEAPGQHALFAGFTLEEAEKSEQFISGPFAPFVVSNLCQFSLSSASFQPETGVNLRARLPESNGRFRIELKSPDGECLKTISGSTSNGIIKVHWDLKDEHGGVCTNDAYDSVFHVTLPDSGRSQTMKGP